MVQSCSIERAVDDVLARLPMHIHLGLPLGLGKANRFVNASQVTDWSMVVSARVELVLVGGSDNTSTATQPYVFGGQSVTPTDRRQRSVVSTLVSLRNTVP